MKQFLRRRATIHRDLQTRLPGKHPRNRLGRDARPAETGDTEAGGVREDGAHRRREVGQLLVADGQALARRLEPREQLVPRQVVPRTHSKPSMSRGLKRAGFSRASWRRASSAPQKVNR